jgi:hypothetical protein
VQAHAQPPCIEQEAAQQQNELIGGQAAVVARPCEPPQHEPSLGKERILMMDYVSTPARAKGVTPLANCEKGHTKAATARPSKASPPPIADKVDKMYHQLVEIHAISTTQLAECVHWCQSNPTPNTAHAGTGW